MSTESTHAEHGFGDARYTQMGGQTSCRESARVRSNGPREWFGQICPYLDGFRKRWTKLMPTMPPKIAGITCKNQLERSRSNQPRGKS